MHGAIYLMMKTEGDVQVAPERCLPYLMGGFVVLNTLVVIASVALGLPFTDRYLEQIWPIIFPAAALVAMGAVWCFVQQARYFPAFIASSLMILLLLVAGAIGMHPNLIISSIDAAYNLTIFNAASEDNTMTVAPDHRAHRDAVRAAIHDRCLLHLPRQGHRRADRQLLAACRPDRRGSRDRPARAAALPPSVGSSA